MSAKSFKRTGLHRLECEQQCGAYVYATVAALERYGMPRCPCGAAFFPDHPELAMILAPDSPAAAEFQSRVADAWHGQTSRGPCDTTERLRAPEVVALEGTSKRPGLLAERAAAARERRLIGLKFRTLKTPDDIPF